MRVPTSREAQQSALDTWCDELISSELGTAPRLIGLILARITDHGVIEIANPELARRCRVDLQTLERARKALVNDKWISYTPGGRGRAQLSRYELQFAAPLAPVKPIFSSISRSAEWITHTYNFSEEQALTLAEHIRKIHKPKSLLAYVRKFPIEDLRTILEDLAAESESTELAPLKRCQKHAYMPGRAADGSQLPCKFCEIEKGSPRDRKISG